MRSTIVRRAGIAALAFFTIKGLLWLGVIALAATHVTRI